MFSRVKLVTGEKSDVILVDEDSLDREGSIEFVWVIDEKGRAYRKRVLTGAKNTIGVEILAGLKAGDIVVITGQLKLTDGSLTKILNKKEMDDGNEEADGVSADRGEGDPEDVKDPESSDDPDDKSGEKKAEDSESTDGDSSDKDDDSEGDKNEDDKKEDSKSTNEDTLSDSGKNEDSGNDKKTEEKVEDSESSSSSDDEKKEGDEEGKRAK
jgi:hypothetical protein